MYQAECSQCTRRCAWCHWLCEYFLLVCVVLCMPNACTVRVVQEWCSVPNPIKPVSLVACFSWLAHLQVCIPHWIKCCTSMYVGTGYVELRETNSCWRWRSPMNYTALASSPLAPLYYSLPESFQRTCNMKRMPLESSQWEDPVHWGTQLRINWQFQITYNHQLA